MSGAHFSFTTLPAVVAIRRGALGLAIVAGLALGGGAAWLQPAAAQRGATAAEVAAEVNPAVVTITNLQEGDGRRASASLVAAGSGSGFIIDAAGHVVTNNHVVEGADAFEVLWIDGTTVAATLIGADPWQDVAVLQLELAPGQTVPGIAALGDSDAVRAGDMVIALGNPYGEFPNSVSIGVANALDREIAVEDRAAVELPNLIQHDADIYPGNSGGPLIDLAGEVVGINVAGAEEGDIGFAIEIDAARPVIAGILEDGVYDRAWLGITGEAQVDRTGQLVQQVLDVTADAPAATAGVRAGDVITAIDGEAFSVRDSFVASLLFEHTPGETITLTVLRDGAAVDLTVTLGTRPEAIAA